MNFLHSIILGIVEGVTEFLPISSTAHLDLARQLLGLGSGDFIKTFEVAIQLGAIMSVVVLYWQRLTTGFTDNLKKLLIAFVPTGILGLIFYQIIKTYLFGNNLIMALALILGGLAIWLLDRAPDQKQEDSLKIITYRQAFVIGLCQSLAMIPGVSRSAATIMGGLSLGISRTAIVEFSFLLAIPTMLAATGLDLFKTAGAFSGHDFGLLAVGFLTSFVVALGAIKFFLSYIQKHDFKLFAIYRVVVGLLIIWLMFE
jgi:undecaprenyl-diphosphatase